MDIYTVEMLNHDYTEEAMNYIDAEATDEEIVADVKEILNDNYTLEAPEIVTEYVERLLAAVHSVRA